jgi:general secretion pathway protein F
VAIHELATLLESGVPLSDAVASQSRGSHHPTLAAAFEAMRRELLRGTSFLEAVRGCGLPLPEYVYQLVEAGEMSGRLAASLREAVTQLEYDERIAGDVRGALTYPAVLVVSGIAAVLLVFVFVVPKFADLLRDAEDLPLLSRMVIGAGIWFNDNAALAVGIAVGAAILLAGLLSNAGFRARLTDAAARLPVLGAWFSEVDAAKWASVMAAMLASRVELMDALGLAAKGVRISSRRTLLERAHSDVKGGSALSDALEKQGALTAAGYNLVRVGEQAGRLAETLRAVANLYEDSTRRRTARLLALVEPLAILLIGGAIGTIMVGLILGITSINELAS